MRIKQWVGSRGDSNNFSIFLEAVVGGENPPSSFKHEDYINIVKDEWVPFDRESREYITIQFMYPIIRR
jgi:hypothetical protein